MGVPVIVFVPSQPRDRHEWLTLTPCVETPKTCYEPPSDAGLVAGCVLGAALLVWWMWIRNS